MGMKLSYLRIIVIYDMVQNIFKIKISVESILVADEHDDSSRILLYKEITITTVEDALNKIREVIVKSLENPFRFI